MGDPESANRFERARRLHQRLAVRLEQKGGALLGGSLDKDPARDVQRVAALPSARAPSDNDTVGVLD